MFSIWFLTITLHIALADQKYQYPKYDGAFCCDKTKNLIINGHFEQGNAYFDSSYTYNSAILPSQYYVANDATNFLATVTDHSYCEDPKYFPMNDRYLLVNGLTNQPAGSKSVIWGQKIEKLKKGRYRFCANFKNLQQCTYDVLPEVTVEVSSGWSQSKQTVTIDTDQDKSCDWQRISFCFYAANQVTVKIILKESTLGDGNDLAIDDVSIQEVGDPKLTTTIQYQYNTKKVLGSINTISTNDDMLPCKGFYSWSVFTVQSFSGGTFTINWSAPFGWGNSMYSVRYNPYAVGPPWQLTTFFPGFPFSSNKLYAIGMKTSSCCEECLDKGFTYHVVYPIFFKRGKSDGKGMVEDTYTSDYGLTEKDLLDVEQRLATFEASSEEEAIKSRDQRPESSGGK